MAIAMQHPDVETMAVAVDEDQFLVVWRPRGWERLGEVEAFASEQLGVLVRDLNDLTIEELISLGAVRGAEEIPRSAKKALHLKAFTDTFGAPVPVEDAAPDDAVVADEKAATPAT